jgi:hypothetical protein
MRLLVDGFQHETVEILVLRLAHQIIVQVVNFYFFVFGAENMVNISINFHRLSLPNLQIVTAHVDLTSLQVPM